jgi:hypothetical protein
MSAARLLFAVLLLFPALCAVPTTIVGVKVIKSNPGRTASFTVRLPTACGACTVLSDTIYQGQNSREIFFHLQVPVTRPLISDIAVDLSGTEVREVIVEKSRIHFVKTESGISFDLPVAPRARSSTVELQTSLEWPGIVVRIEHAFPERRAGKYASGTWPALERQAALNLEFGLREALRDLQLGRDVGDRGLGKIHLMGFDTNNPLGHEDYPPHIHLILRWPHFAGSQAPHFYITDKGLLSPDVIVTIDGMPHIAATHVPANAWLPAVDYLGAIAFETKVTASGGLILRRTESESCELNPWNAGPEGFASGTRVACSSGKEYRVRAVDDVSRGELRVEVAGKPPELYRYDVDTAVLLSAEPPLN